MLVITLVAALGMASVGVVVYAVERGRILGQLDERLADNLLTARYIVAAGDPSAQEQTAWPTSRDALYAVVQRMSPDDNTGALGIVDGEPALAPGVPLDVDLTSASGFVDHVVARARSDQARTGVYAEEGVQWRYLVVPIAVETDPAAEPVVYTMVYDVSAELSEIDGAAQAYLLTAGIAVLLIAAAGGIVATRLLRPLRRMNATAARVSAQSLDERLPVDGRDDVSELAVTMNGMLDRLDAAWASQRELLSDVGHELKTPITIVRGYVEVMDAHDPADVDETRDLAVDELQRMGRLVQDLAASASLQGPAALALREVDAAELLHTIIRKAAGIEGATVAPGDIAAARIVVDPGRITQAALQLAQNAVTHGGGSIVMGSRRVPAGIEIWVRDHGPGVPDAQKKDVFERFHRGGASQPGSGLGLNIVRVIARAHGGDVVVVDAPGGGALFLITLPTRPADTRTEELAWLRS